MFANIQEREEAEFNRMGPAEEMRWQHAQGMQCSFDCAACDAAAEAEYQTYRFDHEATVEEIDTAADWYFTNAETRREAELNPPADPWAF